MNYLKSSFFSLLASSFIDYSSAREVSDYSLQIVKPGSHERENVPYPRKQTLPVTLGPIILPRKDEYLSEFTEQENSLLNRRNHNRGNSINSVMQDLNKLRKKPYSRRLKII